MVCRVVLPFEKLPFNVRCLLGWNNKHTNRSRIIIVLLLSYQNVQKLVYFVIIFYRQVLTLIVCGVVAWCKTNCCRIKIHIFFVSFRQTYLGNVVRQFKSRTNSNQGYLSENTSEAHTHENTLLWGQLYQVRVLNFLFGTKNFKNIVSPASI